MQDDSTPSAGTGREDPQTTRTVHVHPLGYEQLRLLAECAAGAKDEVDFISVRGLKPEVYSQFTYKKEVPLTNEDVLIPASNANAKFPGNAVRLSVGGDHEPSGSDGALPPGVDAVFWSDAAVHKFVVPYVASCAGTSDALALQQLQQAWNYYPSHKVTVLALLHATHFAPDTRLSLDKVFWVAYQHIKDGKGRGPVLAMRLDEFLSEYPSTESTTTVDRQPGGETTTMRTMTPAAITPSIVEYHRGAGSRETYPEYASLRAMAEYACSIRDEPRYFLCRSNEVTFTLQKYLPPVSAGDIVIPVQTPTVPPGRPQLGGVWFQSPGMRKPKNLAGTADALFWSTGSIEQFLAPYYASKVGLANLGLVQRIAAAWLQDRIFKGPQGDVPEPVTAFAADERESGEVDGLVHLYTSEWVEEDTRGGTPVSAVDPTHELGVVGSAAGAGGVTSIADLLAGARATP